LARLEGREGTGQPNREQADMQTQSFPDNWESHACGFSGRVARINERVLALLLLMMMMMREVK
jgi:hypothetical protein